MSWYVSYYIGYRTKDGKIYPLGPFDSFGKLKSILNRFRSFTKVTLGARNKTPNLCRI